MLASLGRALLGFESSIVGASRPRIVGSLYRCLSDTPGDGDDASASGASEDSSKTTSVSAEESGSEALPKENAVDESETGASAVVDDDSNGADMPSPSFEEDDLPIAYYETPHKKGRHPSRAEIGNYSDAGTLDTEMLLDWEAKDDGKKGIRLYDLPKWLRHNMPEGAPRPRIHGLLADALKDDEIRQLRDYFMSQESEFRESETPSIFKWEVQFVLSVGGEDHPANRKVKLRVYMTELQELYDLDDKAVQHICKICQKRYNPKNGMLTLSVEKYPYREDNRRECMRIIEALVLEGLMVSPGITPDGYLKSDPFETEGESEESKAGGEAQTMSL